MKGMLVHKVVWPFTLITVIGSIMLLALFHLHLSAQADRNLKARVETNADFLRSTAFPPSALLANNLGRMLQLRIIFRWEGRLITDEKPLAKELTSSLSELPADGVVRTVPRSFRAIATTVDDRLELIALQPAETLSAYFRRKEVLLALVLFWGLSAAFALAVIGNLVRPLQALTRALPDINTPSASPELPGAQRSDEIGHLARTFLDTHQRLLKETAAREQAERMAALARVATGLAHEIRNPLAAIRMHPQLRPENASTPAILHATAQIDSLVNQWLFLARPEPPARSPASVRETVETSCRLMDAHARQQDVQIENRVSPKLTWSFDRRRMEQVFGNLILNAVQAMPEGGRLVIDAHADAAHLQLSFEDTGTGFSPTALARFGELFYSEKEGGMGVGLAVAREIVAAHGGRLTARNDKPSGAVVTVEIPS